MKPDLFVIGGGAITSVGFSLPATTAAIRGGLDCFSETSFLDDVQIPIAGAKINDADLAGDPTDESNVLRGGTARAAHFVALAIEEAIADSGLGETADLDLFIVLPDGGRPNPIGANLCDSVVRACHQLFKRDLFTGNVKSRAEGEVGICHGLRLASQWLETKRDESDDDAPPARRGVVVASFDSWLNVPSIQHGLAGERLLVSESSDGFIPGESASAIVLSHEPRSQGASLKIVGIGLAEEEAHVATERPNFGIGLGQAMDEALTAAGLEAHEIHHRLTNLSGEEFYFKESAFAWARLLTRSQPRTYQYEQPASSLGAIGAAFGPLLFAYALSLAGSGCANGTNTLIQLTSDQKTRGTVVAIAT